MLLKSGDCGEAVRDLQRGLNRLGSILLVDGDFGKATRAAVLDARTMLGEPGDDTADDGLQAALTEVPDPFPPLTAAGVTFIARQEITAPQTYRDRYEHPEWPSPKSGITIGIGYDLQYADRNQFAADFGPYLSADAMARLADAVSCPGSEALLATVRDIEVPLLVAMAVFIERSLPLYLQRTIKAFPEVENLPPARQTALVSLVYNRGGAMEDNKPGDRREMRAIRDLLAAGRTDEVAEQFESMTRLWVGQNLAGLVQRRHDEATLWRSGFAALRLE